MKKLDAEPRLQGTVASVVEWARKVVQAVNALAGAFSGDVLKIANGGTSATTAIGARAALGAQLEPGVVGYTAAAAPPPGWLKRNGAAVSRTTYAALFAAIGTTYGVGDGSTTFNLPEARGEFDRGWDDGRGIDAGRVLGSAQGQQTPDHYHPTSFGWDGGSLMFMWNDGSGNPVFGSDVSVVGGATISGKTTGNATITGRFARTNTKAGETGVNAPRNVAYLAIIKY